jgi:hypothetical protein
LVGRRETKTPFRRLWHRWEDYIKIHIKQVGRAWTVLISAHDRDNWEAAVGSVMGVWVL